MSERRTQPCVDLVVLEGNDSAMIFDTTSCYVRLYWLIVCLQDKSGSRHPSLPRSPRWSISSTVLFASRKDQL